MSSQKTMVWRCGRWPEVLGDLGGHRLVALFQHQLAVHVGAGIDAVFDKVAMLVGMPAVGRQPKVSLSRSTRITLYGQEAILDALLEAVGVDGIAKVVDVGHLGGFLRRSGQADLGRRAEVAQDSRQAGVLGRAAAVTLIHDDEVEEVRAELLVDVALFPAAGDGLVQRQVDS